MNTSSSKKTKEIKTDAKTKTSWGSVANWYDELVETNDDSYQKKVIMPNLMRIVDPKPGVCIFENACGQGYFARTFARSGATVIASDISPELITLARDNQEKVANTTKTSVTYQVAAADNLSFQSTSSVDVVVIVLALQNIENVQGTIQECARVLKANGRFIFVLNHPTFRIPGRSSWQWDAGNNTQYRRLDAYMSDSKNKIDMSPGEKDAHKKRYTYSFHRPLQTYIKALSKAGLAVIRLEEWISHKESQKGPRADEENRIRKEIPLFMCVEAVKL